MSLESLEGRVALVTGASSGVGRATALALAKSGATVYAAARREPELRELATASPAIHAVPLDVAQRPAVDEAIAAIEQQAGRLDIVACAAGVNVKRRRFNELSQQDWQYLMDVNATGPFNVVQSALPLLRASTGLVIIINSISGRWADASGPAYQASKRAALGFAHAVAWEEQGSGVRVSSVLPGLIDTPLMEYRPQRPSPEDLARALTAEDVAEVCLFLARLHPRVIVPEVVMAPAAFWPAPR